jgi:hypothetical protein
MTTFTAAGILNVGAPTKDGGASIRIVTNEITDEEYLKLLQYNQTFGYVLWKPNQFTDTDIPKEDAPDNGKKPSQRLRNSLFVLWTQRGSKGDFNAFYVETMEKFISEVKSKLDL